MNYGRRTGPACPATNCSATCARAAAALRPDALPPAGPAPMARTSSVRRARRSRRTMGFGLVETWWTHRPGGPPPILSPRYAAPNCSAKSGALRCDQYSLALIYTEMLTGTHPWRGRGTAWATANPDLGLLPRHDRSSSAERLNPDYRQRFETNAEMIDALDSAGRASARRRLRRNHCSRARRSLASSNEVAGLSHPRSIRA